MVIALKPALSRQRLWSPAALASGPVVQPVHSRQPRRRDQRERAFAEMSTGCCNWRARSSNLLSDRWGKRKRPPSGVLRHFGSALMDFR